MNYENHPIANIFPMLPENELKDLASDIKENGLKQKIVIYEGKILDGRNRYVACKMVGVDPDTTVYSGDSPASFVISLNLKRRHLTPSQAAAASVEALPWFEREAKERQRKAGETFGRGKVPQKVAEAKPAESREQVASLFNTNRQYVSDAKKLKEEHPEKFEEVKSGEKTITQAKREITKERLIKVLPEMPKDTYRVIYADPPWKYGDTRNVDGWEGTAAEDHYPTMSINELCSMPMPKIQDNAVLFLWTTSPLLYECEPVFKAWGFEYKTSFIWDKIKHNLGHYNSVRHEILLVCTRGQCTPDNPKAIDSVQSIERTKHSRKPEEFRGIIDMLYPNGKRIELFAREKVDGWDAWGNQV